MGAGERGAPGAAGAARPAGGSWHTRKRLSRRGGAERARPGRSGAARASPAVPGPVPGCPGQERLGPAELPLRGPVRGMGQPDPAPVSSP